MLVLTLSKTTELPKTNFSDSFIRGYTFVYTTPSWWATIGGTPESVTTAPTILSVAINYILLTQVDSYTEMVAAQSSWYYSGGTLYIHFPHLMVPESAIVQYGAGIGYSDTDVVYINDAEYLPLITSFPKISQKENSGSIAAMAFLQMSLELNANGGSIDDFISEPLIGNAANIAYIEDKDVVDNRTSLEKSTPLSSFFVEKLDYTPQAVTVALQDIRKTELKVPTLTFESSAYTYLDPDVRGKVVPLIYGQVRNAPAQAVNSTQTGTLSATYRAGLVLTTLTTVYLKIGDTWKTATPSSTDLANGSFTVASARSATGEEPYECKVDCVGIAVTYASDIIKDLYSRYLNQPFTSQYFDTTEWVQEQVALPTCGIVVDKSTDLFKLINQVQNGVYPRFRFEINALGKKTIRVDDEDRAVKWRIEAVDIQNQDSLTINEETSNLYAGVTVLYNKSWLGSTYQREINDDYAVDVLDNYQISNTTEIETLLPTQALAISTAASLAQRYSHPDQLLSCVVMGSDYFTIRIFDVCIVATQQSDDADLYTIRTDVRDWAGTVVAQVLEVAPDYQKKTVKLLLRVLDRVYVRDDVSIIIGDEISTADIIDEADEYVIIDEADESILASVIPVDDTVIIVSESNELLIGE